MRTNGEGWSVEPGGVVSRALCAAKCRRPRLTWGFHGFEKDVGTYRWSSQTVLRNVLVRARLNRLSRASLTCTLAHHKPDHPPETNMATHLVKIKLDGDLRIMEIPSPPRFDGLVNAVMAAYAVPTGNERELTFTYKDTDGDEVRVNTAVACSFRSGTVVVYRVARQGRVRVRRNG